MFLIAFNKSKVIVIVQTNLKLEFYETLIMRRFNEYKQCINFSTIAILWIDYNSLKTVTLEVISLPNNNSP